ncbi:MAG: hypothetical protein EZS28_050643, partial [Streblomastix strix]
PSISTSQSSETTSSNIIPIPTPSVHQVQQEKGHLLLPPVAVSPPPINSANIELPPAVGALPDNTTQPINYILIPQLQAQDQQQLVNQQQQLFNLQSQQFTNQQYRLPDPPDSWSSITTQPLSLELRAQQGAQRLHDQRILQENRARNEYRIHIQQRVQNKAQKFLVDWMHMNLEARSKGFDNLSYHSFGNFQLNFNPNQYIDNLSQIPSQDQQNIPIIQMNIKYKEMMISRVMVMYLEKQIQYSYKQEVIEEQERKIEGSTQTKLKIPEQRRGKTGAAN